MYSIALSAVALLAAVVPPALAQTSTSCQPLNTTGCPNMPALGGNATFAFNETWNPQIWSKMNKGAIDRIGSNGTSFGITRSGDSPTLASKFYIFFGRLEVIMKAATGQGIISSAILQSEDLDEIDWEFKGGSPSQVMTNYFGKGNRTMGDRGRDFDMEKSPMDDYHNYTLDWTKERIQWILDDKIIREVKFNEALPGGTNYPQTPMNVRLGAWAGGDSKNNEKETVKWAGGETDFDKGPFAMIVKHVYVQDYTSAKEYSWEGMDSSGSWEKVKILGKDQHSKIYEQATQPHGMDRIKALSTTAKIAIAASVGGTCLLAICLLTFCCIKQRRAGRREHATFMAQRDQEAADFTQHKQNWRSRSSRYAPL